MSDTRPEEVLAGHVLSWHSEEGWGVLFSEALPDQAWAHFSAIQTEGFRELTAGQLVSFSAEEAEQDEYRWRAVRVWPEADVRHPANGNDGPGYSSELDISFDS
ncbi:cold-shock protein [Streptomyces sp. AC550_RSS872]|uniref:cold-shock protein n=1 Tax=Streptomyces sp. AC550_RSS872 TaxID=2823689 RepID=UPI0020B85E44|nr:cold shock domain-containing protein [Streptomyces sp. AC550_RSS872]